MNSISISRFLILTFYLFISGCGFHLRGAVDYNFSFMHIDSSSANIVAQEVKRRLLEEGIEVVPMASAAQAVLYLRNETVDKRVLTVSSISGKLEEFELDFRVEMEIRHPNDKILMEKQVISLSRDYSFDETAVLAMWAEEEMLRQNMFNDIVAQIMRRLQTLKLGKIALTELKFEGLRSKYLVGEQLTLDLIEQNSRTLPVDIWLSLASGEDLLYIIPSQKSAQPWQFSQQPQPLQHNVPATQTRHRLLSLTLPQQMSGKYTLRAVYTIAGAGLDLENMLLTMRSNIVEGSMVIEK